ncbi:MAG: hypothetical protein N3A68_08370 [Bacteroidia bacterium]|nr:hypothetical protein [Bacteroidia bacterium]GIV24276.1 MAG: hypothetical protein KatS3mg025_1935 [Bacteroidia bacterium]
MWQECRAAWELTRLRVAFRYHWLAGLLSERNSPEEKKYIDMLEQLLQKAAYWVKQLPARYSVCAAGRLCRAGRRGCKPPHPSYRFGYLYPAVSLHFWRRESGQLKEGRWAVWYQNTWDIPRIKGLW